MLNPIHFSQTCDKILSGGRALNGIGTRKEKLLHAILKEYFEPNPAHHEIKRDGFIVDIQKDTEIIEIQTRSFHLLRRKLDVFLPQVPVHIVLPLPSVKWLSWVDPQSGETTPKRRSPKAGTFYDAIKELYKIKSYLSHKHLTVHLLLLEMQEYRLLDGWSTDHKKGSHRYERIPLALTDEKIFSSPDDYRFFLPNTLANGQPFTSKIFAKEAHIRLPVAQTALNILCSLNVCSICGKEGRSNQYCALLSNPTEHSP